MLAPGYIPSPLPGRKTGICPLLLSKGLYTPAEGGGSNCTGIGVVDVRGAFQVSFNTSTGNWPSENGSSWKKIHPIIAKKLFAGVVPYS
jgi:hypothetical protein